MRLLNEEGVNTGTPRRPSLCRYQQQIPVSASEPGRDVLRASGPCSGGTVPSGDKGLRRCRLQTTGGVAAAGGQVRTVWSNQRVVLLHVESRSDRRTFNGRSTDGRFSERLLLVSRHALIEVGAWLVSSCLFSSCTLLFVAALTI